MTQREPLEWAIHPDHSAMLNGQPVVVIGETSVIRLPHDLKAGTLIVGTEAFNALLDAEEDKEVQQ